jgi:hypothetical protein
MIAQTHHMGSCNRTPPKPTKHLAIMAPSTKPKRTRRDAKIHRGTSPMRNHTRIMKPVRCKLLFHKKERRKITPCPRLSTNQQMDKKEQERIPLDSTNDRQTKWMLAVHQVRRPMGVLSPAPRTRLAHMPHGPG